MFMRHWTLEEANALIPLAREACARIGALVAEADDLRERLGPAPRPPGTPGLVTSAQLADRQALERLGEAISEQIGRLHELGGQVKSLDPFLVDFPARLGGRTVLLCWRDGEDRISHYHATDGGYSSRQPIEDPAAFGVSPVH